MLDGLGALFFCAVATRLRHFLFSGVMIMGKPGRKKKYGTAKELEQAVDAYWNSISYEKPAVVSTPTGEVDERGGIKYATKLLAMNADGSVNFDGTGKPKTITEYLEPPSVAGLCIFLGVSKETWADYARDEKLSPVCARFKLRLERYLLGRLNSEKGKNVQGIIFNLKNNFGYADKVEHSGETALKIAMEPEVEELAE